MGHKHYQFDFSTGLESFEQRMEIEAERLQKEDDVPKIHQVQDEILPETGSSGNIDSAAQNEDGKNIDFMEEILLEIIDSVSDAEEMEEDHREEYQFNYNLHTCFQDDHPELDAEDTTIALSPGEGKRPTSIIMDDEWDMKTHPFLDPSGQNNMSKERKVKLRDQQFFEQRILNEERIFSNTPSWIFAAVNYLERRQMKDRINISFQRGQKRTLESGQVEYSLEDAFSVLDKMKNTPRYWRQRRDVLFAMLENLGPFTWFFTLSCADYRYEENFTSLLQDHHVTYIMENGVEKCLIDGQTIEEFLSQHETQHEFIRKNTLTATRNFQH